MEASKKWCENAKDYATVAKERNAHIHIEYISQVEINDMKSTLDVKCLDVYTVPGTHQLHCVILNGPEKLLIADTSDVSNFKVVSIRNVEGNNDDAHKDDGEKKNVIMMMTVKTRQKPYLLQERHPYN